MIGDSTLALAGTLMAQGYSGHGGEIDLTGGMSRSRAPTDASGASGGGAINIGGGPHATVALARRAVTRYRRDHTISADATDNGNGGHIVSGRTGQTTVAGTFSAMGGPNGGNGGSIETSGETLELNGITVNALAPNGKAGTWLLDPTDLIDRDEW